MRESPAEASVDSQNNFKPQTKDTSQNSNSESDPKTFAEIDSTPKVRKGFRRKKGESPYVCDMNVKFKKEKKQSTFLSPDPWARLVSSRNTTAIYIDGIATTALYDTGAELQLISKEFCEQNHRATLCVDFGAVRLELRVVCWIHDLLRQDQPYYCRPSAFFC